VFIVNQLYPRDALKAFIGTKDIQSGILSPTGAKPEDTEYVILSSGGKHGEKIGYQDEKLASGKWLYFGQGGDGDQEPTRMANRMVIPPKNN
jgi:hypothetical protein